MESDPLEGAALRPIVTSRSLAVGTSTVEIAADGVNLKGYLHKNRCQTAMRWQTDWSLVDKRDEVELCEDVWERHLVGSLDAH